MLNLEECSKLQRFPDIPNKNKSLQEIYLRGTSIEELPTSIGNLVSLKEMYLYDCKKLAILPSSIYRLQHLEVLQLGRCSQLIKFPKKDEGLSEPHTKMGFPKLSWLNLQSCHLPEVEFLENLFCPCLRKLNLTANNFTNLPSCERLNNLEYLEVSYCQQLQEIPKIPKKLRRLEATNCKSLNRVPSNICDIEEVELFSCQELVRNGFFVNDLFKLEKFHHQTNCRIILPGGEMPKWLIPDKEGYMSFVASKDLYKKILGVAFCVVFRLEGGSSYTFELLGVVNCKGTRHKRTMSPCDVDHVWLEYMESKKLWTVDHFGPNDSSHLHVSIRVDPFQSGCGGRAFVKKCGFRLICKPLKNDLEVLLQDDQLLDSAFLYEISHEDNPMSTEEESSSEIKNLQDSEMCTEEEELNMVDFSIEKHRYSSGWSYHRSFWPVGEMPKGFLPNEDGTISFMASQDLYDKFNGLYLCVVFSVEDGKKEVSFDIVPHVNGQRRNVQSGTLGSFDTDHSWFQFFEPNRLWGVLEGAIDFGQFGKRYLRFDLNVRVVGATMKKLGYMMQCRPLEDALKVELEKNQLMDPSSLFEDDEEPRYYGSCGWEALRKRLEYKSGLRGTPY
ncbi:hypothetical protein BT93_L0341 [Corymbia citriodora subsp. variegata]|uniref:Disease resistance protein RPS4B/Roq1-like leucine-rich repeats domain-containing protein n=1 Tax=Corymbia citriodora subsp. variegata TaxID=360336 RepID=A0A8T0CTU5_CORYI|nr:hypothetical protein BT93_L0341 [Corymbia citriodora subsp. variegata]